MQVISIFVSSTFKDMMCERDVLRRYVLPELSSYYNPRGFDVQLIDLRWGIVTNDDSALAEKKILKCCVDAIDASKPFFIGFLGHRYGWIPHGEDLPISDNMTNTIPLSVTQLEILHGVFKDNNYSRSLIFLRNASSYDNIPEEELVNYVEEDNKLVEYADFQRNKIKDGYQQANATENIIGYTLRVYNPSIDEIFKFSQIICANLKRVIDAEIGCNINYSIKHSRDLFLSHYIPSEKLLCDTINDLKSGKHVLIYGDHGTGKTSFALYIYNLLSQIDTLVNGFIYSSDFPIGDISSLKEAILSWSEELSNGKFSETNTIEEEWKRFRTLHANQSNPTIIILDGYDKIHEIRNSNMFMLPANGILYIVTSSCHLPKWENRFQISPYEIEDFSQDEACQFINEILKHNEKELPSSVFNSILQCRRKEDNTYNPLDLSILLSYMLSLGKEEFDKIYKTHALSGESAIYERLTNILKEMPRDSLNRSNYIVRNMRELFNEEQFLPLLYASYSLNGLTEANFMKLMPTYNPSSFYLIRNYLKPYLPSQSSDGKWKIYNSDFINVLKTTTSDKDESFFFYNLSILDSIPEDEKFYYALYGHNHDVLYTIYSSHDESKGHLNHKINYLLQAYFEEEDNIERFLAIMKPHKDINHNNIIVGNLIFSFISHFARQDPRVNTLKLLFSLRTYIESEDISLDYNDKNYYLGILSEGIGREMLNRNIDKTIRGEGIMHLKKAIDYYKLIRENDMIIANINQYLSTLE